MKGNPVFESLRIIDLSTVLAGPSVGTFFAELGAEVIKIEHPNHPDITRSWRLPQEENRISAYFSSVNYRKQYQQLNLKIDHDRNELLNSVKQADVLLMNFKTGAQERLRIPDEVLRKENPKLIIGKISGFGADSQRVAYDLILQAESGYMAMNGTPDSGPVKIPVALIDVLAAHQLKEGILIELLKKASYASYKGKSVSVSLYDAAVTSLVNQASNYLMAGHIPQRIGSLHPNIAPYGELFVTADGKTITFAIGTDLHFEKLCTFLDLKELPKQMEFSSVQARVTHRKELYQLLVPVVKKWKASEILKAMHRMTVPCGEIKNLEGVFQDPEAQALVREEEIDGEITKRVSQIAFKIT